MVGCFSEIDLGDKPESTLKHIAHNRRTAARVAEAIDSEDALLTLVGSRAEMAQTLGEMPTWVKGKDGNMPPAIARWIMSQAAVLRSSGPIGNWLADRLVGSRRLTEQLQSRYRGVVSSILADLTPDEKGRIWRYLELGEDHGPKVAQAGDRLARVRRQLYDRLRNEGVDVGPDLGEKVFPHAGFDYEALGEAGNPIREEALKDLMDQGAKTTSGKEFSFKSKAEAESYLDVWLYKASKKRGVNLETVHGAPPSDAGRVAGTFEIERRGMPGWTKDPEAAFLISLNDGSRRLAETLTLGNGSKEALKAIRLLNRDNPEVAKWGHELLKQTLGASPTGISNPFLAGLYDLGLTRLTFTPFMAVTEIPKLYVKSGFKPFFRGLSEFFSNPLEATRRAQWLGAVLDNHLVVQSAGATTAIERSVSNDLLRNAPKSLLGRGVKKLGESIAHMSSMVDNWTRTMAVGAGDALFSDLVDRIKLNGGAADSFVKSRFKEFKMNASVVEKALAAGDDLALERLNNFMTKELADQVVFTHRPTDKKRATTSEYGRLFDQFRGFGTKQMEFSVGELTAFWREGTQSAKARSKRMLHLLLLANPVMAYGVASLKGWLTGRESWTDERWDMLKNDPTFTNWATYTMSANAFLGSFGLLSDITHLMARGNRFDLNSFGRPAAFGAIGDMAQIAQGLRDTALDDAGEGMTKATTGVGRLFGAPGGAAAQKIVDTVGGR